MSIEVTLYPSTASREDLSAHLLGLGYEPSDHLWEWPEGARHYYWFKTDEHVSFDGVEATVYPGEETDHSHSGNWILHTRTRGWASYGDRECQNHTIRTARMQFGGWFDNDSEGRNRYIRLEPDHRDAVARGIYLSYTHVTDKLAALRYTLPDPHESMERLVGTKLEPLAAAADPTRVLYNALFPFAVAAIEHFFSQTFKIMLRHDSHAREMIAKQNKKIEMADFCAIRDGAKTIEDVIADWYSFQSIRSIHAAFKDWFGIDFQSLIRHRKKIGNKLPILEQRIDQLIDFRHGIVHRFSLDLYLRKADLEEIIDLVCVLIDLFVDEVERRRGLPIRTSSGGSNQGRHRDRPQRT